MAWVKTRTTDDGDKRFVGCYRDPDGRQRSAGTYSSRRAAERAAHREEIKVRDGQWHDTSRGEITFKEYVDTVSLPSRHIEASSLAAYQSYLNKHFYPFFGKKQIGRILPSDVQRWVTTATAGGLSPASVRKCSSERSGTGSSRSTRVRRPSFPRSSPNEPAPSPPPSTADSSTRSPSSTG